MQAEKAKAQPSPFFLPFGNAHLKPEEILVNEKASLHLYKHEKNYEEEEEAASANGQKAVAGNGQTHSILIIEDNANLRKFLVERLQGHSKFCKQRTAGKNTPTTLNNFRRSAVRTLRQNTF